MNVVYFVVRESDGAIKIGTTHRIAHRLTELSSEHGPCELLAAMPGDYLHEARLHRMFGADRLRNALGLTEWFRPSDELKDYIDHLPDRVPIDRAESEFACGPPIDDSDAVDYVDED